MLLFVLGGWPGRALVKQEKRASEAVRDAQPPARSVSIDWYSEGEERTVEVDDVRITVRFIGRRGRRGRIAIEAPAGAAFRAG
jgi:hypothetical protein